MTVTNFPQKKGVYFSSFFTFLRSIAFFCGLELWQLHICNTLGYTTWKQCTSDVDILQQSIPSSALENLQSIDFD